MGMSWFVYIQMDFFILVFISKDCSGFLRINLLASEGFFLFLWFVLDFQKLIS